MVQLVAPIDRANRPVHQTVLPMTSQEVNIVEGIKQEGPGTQVGTPGPL